MTAGGQSLSVARRDTALWGCLLFCQDGGDVAPGRAPHRPFRWQLEFPEVFARENPATESMVLRHRLYIRVYRALAL